MGSRPDQRRSHATWSGGDAARARPDRSGPGLSRPDPLAGAGLGTGGRPADGEHATWRWWVGRVGRPLVALVLVAAVGWAAARQWDQVRDTIGAIPLPALLLALLLAMGGMVANVLAFRAVLAALDTRLPVVEACRCYLVGQIGKYLPGSVWAVVLQVELARRAGVPRATGATAALVTLGLSVTSALVVGLVGLRYLFDVGGAVPWVVLGLLPVAVVCAVPPVLTRLVDRTLRLLRRPRPAGPLRWQHVGTVLGATALAWVLFGTHLWLLAGAAGSAGFGDWVRCVGAFALAMTAGSVALVAPSGIGVREAVVVAVLATTVPAGVALGIALASRLVCTLADVLNAAGAALAGARADRRAGAGR
jgi:uncharacterized membrane protein YbhN (UPF0104 family)